MFVCVFGHLLGLHVVTGLGLSLGATLPPQRPHHVWCLEPCPSQFYLYGCQTRSHPSHSSRNPGPAASDSRDSIPPEFPPLPTPGRRVQQGQRPRILQPATAYLPKPGAIPSLSACPSETSHEPLGWCQPPKHTHTPHSRFGALPSPQGAASQL